MSSRGRSFLSRSGHSRRSRSSAGAQSGTGWLPFPTLLLDWAAWRTLARPIALLTPAGVGGPVGASRLLRRTIAPHPRYPFGSGRLEGLLALPRRNGRRPAPSRSNRFRIDGTNSPIGRLTRKPPRADFRPTVHPRVALNAAVSWVYFWAPPPRGAIFSFPPRPPVAAVPIPRDAALVLQSANTWQLG